MTNTELINAIEKDLANVNATKQAHVQIMNILNAYRKEVEKSNVELKNKSKK